MIKLLGLTGKKRSGKDTAGTALIQFAGFHGFSFAKILKAMSFTLLEELGFEKDTAFRMIHGDLKEMPVLELCGTNARHVMQTLGTEWGRVCINENFWVRACIQNALNNPPAVITDCRYPNEAEAIKKQGGRVVRILRDGCNGDGHSSEEMDFPVDYVIENNGSIEQLEQNIIEYVTRGY